MVSFTSDFFKERVFDKISNEYFCKNFGFLGKADFKLLLFSEYLEYCMNNGFPYDDYTLSKYLGITQSRVRSLKERKQLKYPIEEDYWKKSFASDIKNAKYDKEKNRIVIPIEDINVIIEVRHCIEKLGWYDEFQLNRKLLVISKECLTDLCAQLNKDNIFTADAKKQIKKLSKVDGAVEEFAKDFSKDGLKNLAKKASTQLFCDVMKLLPFGGTAKIIVNELIRLICS